MESLNTGKTVTESIGDMEDIAGVFRYYAEIADKDGGEIIDSPLPHSISKVVREPVGVCGQITPWNYPLLQASWKLAPALAAGNTLIDRKSTRLNSSHVAISYAVFCLKKKKKK